MIRRPTVHVWVPLPGRRVPALLANQLDNRLHVVPVPAAEWGPPTADYYVTHTALTLAVEHAALRCQATPVVLPEAAGWLNDQLRKADRPIRLYPPPRVGATP